jgi:nucleoside-diphosphate-sugar epimerase
VAGASGFLGSWLTSELANSNELIALGREKTNFWRVSDNPNIFKVSVPIKTWAEFIQLTDPDVLVLADWSGVASVERNSNAQMDNVLRWIGILSNYKGKNLKTVIGLGSQAELGPISGSIFENTPDNPTTIYGRAKVEGRITLESICRQSDYRYVWMRIFSTYGPLDNGNWLIPNLVDSLRQNKHFELTLGEQEWSYLHAYDLTKAIETVINNEFVNGIVNVGNPKTVSIREVANRVAEYFAGTRLLKFGELPYRQDQVMNLKPVCERLLSLGWSPRIDFDQGLNQTVDWLLGKEPGPLVAGNGIIFDSKLPPRPEILQQP